jgi:hypothetical protein
METERRCGAERSASGHHQSSSFLVLGGGALDVSGPGLALVEASGKRQLSLLDAKIQKDQSVT